MENAKLVECENCANSFVDHRVPADKVYCIKHRVCKWAKPKRQCADFAEKEAKMENEKMDRRNAEEDMKVCEAATAGPWTVDSYDGVYGDGKDLLCEFQGRGAFWEQGDAQFAAMSREALPHWIARAVRAERFAATWKGIAKEWRDYAICFVERMERAESELAAYKAKYGELDSVI